MPEHAKQNVIVEVMFLDQTCVVWISNTDLPHMPSCLLTMWNPVQHVPNTAMWVQQVFHGRRPLQWGLVEDAAGPPSAAGPVSHPEADAATAAIVQAFLAGSTAGGPSLPDPQASASNAAPDRAPVGASDGLSSAAAPDAVPTAAAQRFAPVRGDAGAAQADFPSSLPSFVGAWTGGTAEVAAAAAVLAPAAAPSLAASDVAGDGADSAAPSLAVADVAGDGAGAESACAGLQGNPSDWLVSGGALGYQCAMQVRSFDRLAQKSAVSTIISFMPRSVCIP